MTVEFLPAFRLIELLKQLPPDTVLHPSRQGNALIIRKKSKMIGMIDFLDIGSVQLWIDR